jgi:hypothetical protein
MAKASIVVNSASDVQIEHTFDDGAGITSAFFLHELRHARQRVFAARYQHQLWFEQDRWKIASKRQCL